MKKDNRWFILVYFERDKAWLPLFCGAQWVPAYRTKEDAKQNWEISERYKSYKQTYPNAKVRFIKVEMPWPKLLD